MFQGACGREGSGLGKAILVVWGHTAFLPLIGAVRAA